MLGNVRFGSLAAATVARWRGRFSPNNGHGCRRWSRPLWANFGHDPQLAMSAFRPPRIMMLLMGRLKQKAPRMRGLMFP